MQAMGAVFELEEALHLEGGVDQRGDGFGVGVCGEAQVEGWGLRLHLSILGNVIKPCIRALSGLLAR
jgi:hypothetical protein